MTSLPTYETVRREPLSRTELIIAIVKGHIWKILFAIAFLFATVALLLKAPELPRWGRLVGFTALLSSLIGLLGWQELKQMLPDRPVEVLVDVDARKMDGAVYALPVEWFNTELEVTDGDLNQVAPHLYFGKEVNLEAGTVKGTWRGTLEDRQLIRGLQKVYECRGRLEDDARKGFVLETQGWTLVRAGVRDAVATVVDTFQKGTLPDDGDGLEAAVEDALAEFDLDRFVEDELGDDLDVSEELLDPDGDRDLDDQAEERVDERVDQAEARQQAQQEVAGDD